ncbi:MAG: neutral/alkaline non-lysosomal ceramidase C-terminal domain-containing protein, partial [Pirellulales bacterium]
EFTTMSGRRFRDAVGKELGVEPRYVVVAGYSNDFAGYVTTWHEYQLQQYEGGHTLFGPWSEAAYRQEFVRLAHALKTGESVTTTVEPTDMRTLPHRQVALDGPDERTPPDADFGDVVTAPQAKYTAGETASVTFWTGSPVNEYDRKDKFMAVERLTDGSDTWEVVREDFDWDTAAEWERVAGSKPKPPRTTRTGILDLAPPRYSTKPDPFQVTITWDVSADTAPGKYRLVHYGRHKTDGKVERFTVHSPAFEVVAP